MFTRRPESSRAEANRADPDNQRPDKWSSSEIYKTSLPAL